MPSSMARCTELMGTVPGFGAKWYQLQYFFQYAPRGTENPTHSQRTASRVSILTPDRSALARIFVLSNRCPKIGSNAGVPKYSLLAVALSTVSEEGVVETTRWPFLSQARPASTDSDRVDGARSRNKQ